MATLGHEPKHPSTDAGRALSVLGPGRPIVASTRANTLMDWVDVGAYVFWRVAPIVLLILAAIGVVSVPIPTRW